MKVKEKQAAAVFWQSYEVPVKISSQKVPFLL